MGGFVEQFYGEYHDAGIELPEITFATDKDELEKAHTAMVQAVARMLGIGYHEVTENMQRRYGALVIIPGSPGSPEGAQGFQRRKSREELENDYDEEWERYYQEDYPTVEPGDYFSESGAWPVRVLTGKKMMKFFKKFLDGFGYPEDVGQIPIDKAKEIILRKAIEEHLSYNPTADVDELREQGMKTLNNLSTEELQKYYSRYVRRIYQ